MNIGGVKVTASEAVLVLPRNDKSDNLIIIAHAIQSMEEFNKMCPEPVAPVKITKDGKVPNLTSANYLNDFRIWGKRRHAYICVKSLEPSSIEWDKVDVEKPETWEGWQEELLGAGLCDMEIQRIQIAIIEANSLSDAKLKEAREVFLLGQAMDE